MRIVRRIVYFVSIFLVYVVLRELAELYLLARSLHPVLGYGALALILGFVIYFVFIPIYRIIQIPKNYAPTTDREKAADIIQRRMIRFRQNPYLLHSHFDFSNIRDDDEGHSNVIEALQKEAERLRKRYVLQLFYSSSISQNGFLDAILILSSSVNLVKEVFILYHGRVSNKDLLAIAKRVYLSMAIGGSEGVEYATQELFSKFATEGFKSVPFADRIFGSLADGFVNAALLTRISLITENYCKKAFIDSERELYPSAEFIMRTTKFITSDILEKMTIELMRMSRDKTIDYVKLAINPVGHLFTTSMGKVIKGTNRVTAYPREMIKDAAHLANKPFGYGIQRLSSIFKRKRRHY
ncbi:DUF697 domain-containing protein [candidate division KSB1 bacterium]|nr:DUF697 domain-containing protein [candidate division KSB1 bacterium]NIR73249.1 DUF697 domain-containing protein [candidate division KSB1 bacterium]NIS26955.1 DUF697 domain-containing protein [candidate division KSB1 bacterium]NIT73793.1 DUF697 domain-containing protein [candidate division KSB1 bacterium]NIU27699.1 DUF697 domain-containing protein [candidate division KSB1 bacterium]